MQPISLGSNIQLFPCIQNQVCICCYATNVTQVKHAIVAMRTIPHMQLLPCKQCHTVYIRILDMYIIMLPLHNCNSKFSWSNTCNFYKIKQNHRLFHHENLLIALLSIDRAWQFQDHKTDNESLKIQLESWITLTLKIIHIRNIITKLDGVKYAAVAKHTMLHSLSVKLLPCKQYYVA